MTDTSNENPSKGKILLIDDDKFLLDMYSMKFVQQGYEVHASLSVLDALEVLRGGFNPSAILFDVIMPEQDGFALLEALRRENLANDALKIDAMITVGGNCSGCTVTIYLSPRVHFKF